MKFFERTDVISISLKPIEVQDSLVLPGQLTLVEPNKTRWSWINLWMSFTGNLDGIVFYYYLYHLLSQLPSDQQSIIRQQLLRKFHKINLMLFRNGLYVGWKKQSFLLPTKSFESSFCLILDDQQQIIEVRSYQQFIRTIHEITLYGPSVLQLS